MSGCLTNATKLHLAFGGKLEIFKKLEVIEIWFQFTFLLPFRSMELRHCKVELIGAKGLQNRRPKFLSKNLGKVGFEPVTPRNWFQHLTTTPLKQESLQIINNICHKS